MIKFIILIVIILVILLILSYICYRIMSYSNPEKKNYENIVLSGNYKKYVSEIEDLLNEFKKKEYEEIYIKSYDGLWLSGKYFHVSDNAPLVIGFHGYRSYSYLDMCGASSEMFKMGYNFLLIDERAHGNSQGKTITFGIKEQYDCLSWIEYCVKRFKENTKIILCGISMGASIVLYASSLDIPKNVVLICADCPFSSPKAIVKEVIKKLKLPKISYIFAFLGALIFGHFNLEKFNGLEKVKKSHTPLLLIHGTNDNFVPCDMGKDIIKSHGGKNFSNKKLLLVEEADHGLSYFYDKEKYRNSIIEFLDKIIKDT